MESRRDWRKSLLKTTIYVEGGGNTKHLHTELRQSFQSLFEKAGFKGRLPKVVASGSRNEAYADYCTALNKRGNNEAVLLLVDSEDPITTNTKWQHVQMRDGWNIPAGATENSLFFMVVCMESWFLADINTLSNFYGQSFHGNSLPNSSTPQTITKQTLYDALKNATKNTQKGEYGKGKHSFKILAQLDAAKVKNHGTYSQDFFNHLDKVL